MKKSTLFGFVTGILGANLAQNFGFDYAVDVEWWLVVIGTIIFLNTIYEFCKDDSV